jgi:F420-dependent hydroxymycolic acid dehydrogenase
MTAIGFVLSSEQFPAPHLIEYGVMAENAGFDMVWNSDHFHPWMDNQGHSGMAWVTLAALGQRMTQIPMGTGVTCPTYRYHPSIVAQAFASLAVLYPGRVFLGVGTGEALNEQAATGKWGEYEERSERLVEAIQIIRELWSGEWVNFNGQFYQVQGAKLYDLPQQHIPIYIAGSGKESAALVGKFGDGWITDGDTLKKSEIVSRFREAAQSAGKNPDEMPVLVELFIHVGMEDSAREAAQKWRFLPNAFKKYLDNPDPRSILAQANEEIALDEVMKMMCISPDPQQHIDKIHELFDNGATHVFVHSGQEDQQMVIQFYGEQVLPKIEHERMRVIG